ncbi:MAG: beta-ketoacyl-[acyl-carrier-protein] synthase family protein [Legionellaceae bacterium]
MDKPNRVFITGRGALTSCGLTADDTWHALLKGQSGLGEITQWDLSTWDYRLGGELKAYQPAKLLPDRKLMKLISRQDTMGIIAAMQAVEDSQLIAYRDTLDSAEVFNDETAVYVGSPGNKYVQQHDFLPLMAKTKGDMHAFAQNLFSEIHPTWLLRILPNNVLAYTGITYGFKGANHNITNHAASGMQAILEAYHAIQSGEAERAVVVAYDIGIEPQALFYYERLGLLSTNDLRPFDILHDGTVLAEGAAALVLESESSALARGAHCYAEIKGGLSETEGAGLFSIEAQGRHLQDLLSRTLEKNGVSEEALAMVVAHGNGNPKSDISEAQALTQILKQEEVPVTAFKWSMGHTLCASGVLDAVLTTYALQEQCIPGIANLTAVSEACHGLSVSRETRSFTGGRQHALLINRGFASMNVSLLMCAL